MDISLKNYTAKSACPVCGRYKTAYKDKCHGFLTSDGRFAYCSRESQEGQRQTQTSYGVPLYRHPLTATANPPTPSATGTVAQDTRKPSAKKAEFTKSLQTPSAEPKPEWDEDAMMAALDEITLDRQKKGDWPYSE